MKVITAQNRKTTEVVCDERGVEVEAGLPPSYLPTINNISLDTSASPGKKLGWNGRTAVSVRECRGRVRTMLDPALFIAASANWRYTTVSAPPGSPRR